MLKFQQSKNSKPFINFKGTELFKRWNPLDITPLQPKEMLSWPRKAQYVIELAQDLRVRTRDVEALNTRIHEQTTLLESYLKNAKDHLPQEVRIRLPLLIIRSVQQVKTIEKERQKRETCRIKIEDLEQKIKGVINS